MSSFDEFYKKWKEKNGVTTESGYKNLSNEQKIESANSIVNNFLQNYQNTFNNNTVKNSTNEVYKNKKTSLWDDVKNIASGLGKTGQNIWYGLQNGIKNTQQTIGRAFVNSQANMIDWSNKMNEEMLKSRMNKYPDETNEITKILNNPIISGEQLRKEGEATSNKIQKEKDENSKKIQDNINSIDNTILKKTAELAPSIVQMIPGFLPGGAVYMTGSATGNYYDDAKQRGMSDNEATTYSGIMGLMEGATEMIGIGNLSKAGKGVKALITGAGKEGVKKALKEGAEQITKTSLKSVLKDYGIGIADNVIQEAIIDPIQELTAQTVAGKDKAQWEGIGQKMLQDGINGGLVSAILGGANLGIQSCTGVIQKMNNNQEVAQQELRTAVQDASKQLDVGQIITDSTQQQINKYKDYYQGENLDNNTQKTTIRDFNESAKQYNIDYSNEDLQEINQMFEKREIKAYFDENTFKNNNNAFSVWKPITDEQGNILGREVVFNPKAKDSKVRVQELAIHELGHDLDLNEVQNMILKDASRKLNWESARKSLENTYREAYKNDGINISEEKFKQIVDEEATMSILQRELGNQEYVDRLVNQNQSIAKKIYNWVIDKLNKFTGGKNEKIFWEDIKNKFETAYNQEFNKNENNLKYSVGGKEGLKNIINSNERAEGFKNYKLAKQMAKKGKTNKEIFARTGWFQDKVTGEMKFNFSDKDMDVIPKNYNIGQEYTLKEILKHDTLFEMYPQLKEYTVIIEDMNADKKRKTIKGAYNRYTDVIKLDYRRFNQKADVEGTLIHEIQHAIQKIENFSRGASKVWGKKFYEKSPGEIEARDTSNRLMEEKYNGKDLNDIMPKSGNIEVSILDKMKIGLYNYLKDKKGGVEKSEDVSKNKGKSTQDNSENNGLVLGGINRKNDNRTNGLNIESENNSGSFSFEKTAKRYEDLLLSDILSYNKRDNGTLNIEMYKGKELINQITVASKEEAIKQLGNDISNYIYENANQNIKTLKLEQQNKNDYKPATYKEKQLDIIKKTNPMLDDYHVGIRKIEDIKTFEEAIQDEESFSWGDYSKEDAERDLKRNKVKVYSSYDIKNGTFVSTSYEQALEYAGMDRTKVHSKEIKPSEVAWINGDEGQYANTNQKYALPTKEWKQFVEDNYQKQGRGKNLNEYNLPTKEDMNPKVKFDNDNLIQESQNITDDEIAKVLTENKPNVSEKRKFGAFLKANLVDKGMVFEELSRKTNNRELQGKYDYTLTSEARGQNAIGNARYDYQTTTENGQVKEGEKNAKQICKSLTDIINEVGEDPTDFYNYMYHQLNIDRMTLEDRFGGDTGTNYERKNTIKNKPVFGNSITAEISQKIVQEMEQKNPEFKEYAKDVYDYLDANTNELVKNGVISKETQQLFKEMYPHYVPIARVKNNGMAINVPLDTNRTGINNPIKKAKGGNSDIKPLFQTMADRTLQTYRASARNSFGIELKNTLEKAKQLNQLKEFLDVDSIMENMTNEEQNTTLLQEGKNGKNPTFTVFENGEKVTFDISNDMYDALKPKNELLKRIDDSKLSKVLNKVNNFRRAMLTEYNPVFSLTNAIKDAQDVLLNSQHSSKTYSKIPESTAQILSKGYWYKEYIQNGGEQNSYFKDGEFDKVKNNVPTAAKKIVTFPLKAISEVNNVIEMTPRLAEYIASREQGRSIETSMLDASRVTTNFKAGGDITKTLNRNGFTFLNASVQGMQQQIRNIQEANAKGLKGWAVLATKYAIAGLPVLLLNNLIWKGDDDYEELQDYAKDNYYIIGKTKSGTFIRMPKGRTVATVQKIVSNADDFIKDINNEKAIDIDKLGKKFWSDLKEDISFANDNLAPNNPLDNNIIAPIIQAITNKSWYGEDIVPSRLQDKPTKEQYDESTDKLSIWIGNKTGISPKKINYLLDQYSGGAGDILLPKMTPQAENNVFEDKFTVNPVMKNKYPGEFFNKVDELKVNSNGSEASDEDILKYKYINDVSSDISELYKQKRDIQNSNISDVEKKKQLNNVQKQINELAKNSLSKVDNITKGKNYAQIDNSQYYKDAKSEWNKLSDEDKEKNKNANISLKTYSDYKYKIDKLKQEKVDNGELEKGKALKDADKMTILANANYSDKEKENIYKNYINSEDKKVIVVDKLGLPINEYLKYKSQKFESDKNEDGETIKGSKNQKVYDYLNDIPDKNLSQDYKKIICKMSGINSYDKDIVNFVNNNKRLTYAERKEILISIGFKIDKQGAIQTSTILPIVKYVK